MDRSILHVDMNACYASIECLYDPSIRDKPVAVGGDAEARHGIILAKNQIAKKYGVSTGEALWQAKQKCPQLVIIKPHYDRYLRFSALARQIYNSYTDQVESFGLDECWLDVSGSVHLFGDATVIAEEIRERVKRELGITVSVGVSYNKVFAKLGSDLKKPDAVSVLTRENYRDKVWPLPASDLLYVGRATTRKLYNHGIETIGQLANTDPELLQAWFGKVGMILYWFANGLDNSPVMAVGDETIIKSIGNSTTTPRDLMNELDAKIVFYMLAESVAERMRDHGFLAKTVQISVRDNGLFWYQKQMKLSEPTCLASELCDTAMELLRISYRWQNPLRSIGIRGCDLIPATTPKQLKLFEDEAEREKLEQLERTVDDIRRRFGHYAIYRAVVEFDPTLKHINPKEDHTIHPIGYFKAM